MTLNHNTPACSACKSALTVIDKDARIGGMVERFFRCRDCGNKWARMMYVHTWQEYRATTKRKEAISHAQG
jgi:predicted amidophosphoribosyltransferase